MEIETMIGIGIPITVVGQRTNIMALSQDHIWDWIAWRRPDFRFTRNEVCVMIAKGKLPSLKKQISEV